MAIKQSLVALSLLVTSALASHKHSQIVNYFVNPVFRGRADPVVSPGVVGSHVHLVFGGGGFNVNMTENQAVDAKCTANNIKPDKSNYWQPDLWFHAPNGSFFPVPAREYKVYYSFETSDDDIMPFPIGLHMLAGDSLARSPPGPSGHNIDPNHGVVIPYEIQCVGTKVQFTDEMCTNYGGLRNNIYFPQCYNPKAGLTNYKENTAYASSAGTSNGVNCPPGWIHLPQLNLEVYWDVHRFDGEWTPGEGHIPWTWSHGDPTGAGTHADFVGGWELAALTDAIANCDSPQSFFNGALSDCYPNEKVSAAEGADCTIDSPVDEVIVGELKALPGCNPLQYGPGRAAPAATNCGATTTLSRPISPHSDFTTSKAWQYYGCFTNSYNFVKSLTVALPGVQSIEECIDDCAAKGYSLAGIEYGSQCSCGNTLTPDANGNGVPNAFCNMPCAGNNKEICGGPNLLSVYQKCPSGSSCVNGAGPFADGGGSYSAVPIKPVASTPEIAASSTKAVSSAWSASISAGSPTKLQTVSSVIAVSSTKAVSSTSTAAVSPTTLQTISTGSAASSTIATPCKPTSIQPVATPTIVAPVGAGVEPPKTVTVTQTDYQTVTVTQTVTLPMETLTIMKTVEICYEYEPERRSLHDSHVHEHHH